MKLSYAWLRQFVPLKESATTVGEKLTLHTAELEETIEVSAHFERVFLGKLLEVKAHPKSEKLHIGKFDLGKLGTKQIVFGSVHILEIGEILPLALDGAQLASGLNISDTEIQGEASEGMVCDNAELGLTIEGILRFNDTKLIGKPLTEVAPGFGDTLFDIDNKSLTHRPDLMGHRGFARELSAIFEENLVLPEPAVSLPTDGEAVEVQIQTEGCRRFCALKMSDITVAPGPLDHQIMLENLGVRAISNLVDITNWIMLEYGQPMHVFDADKVNGKIIVRMAKEGEKLMTLDGKEYELTTQDMVVADEAGALSIAGVMGGLDSSVTGSTKNIIFEVANWDPVQIRKTSQRLGIRTESSSRYEKSLDPEWCRKAILAAAEKCLEFCPKAQVASGVTDNYPSVFPKLEIDLNPNLVRRFAGTEISDDAIRVILENLGFGLKKSGEIFKVEVPSFRATKDVALPEDLVEEVIRIYGFESLPSTLPTLPMLPPKINPLRNLEWKTRNFFADNGYLEVYNHSFVKAGDASLQGIESVVEIENPLSDEYQFLRQNLVSNMLRDIEAELRSHQALSFFELGRTYVPEEGVLPNERLKFLSFKAQIGGEEDDLFFELKQNLETYFQTVCGTVAFEKNNHPSKYEHPSKSASILIGGQSIGTISVLHPHFSPTKNSNVVFAEIDLELLESLSDNQDDFYQKLSPYPPVYRDLSIVLDEDIDFGEVKKTMLDSSDLLQEVVLFDDYRDAVKLGEKLKNLAFHLQFRSWERTLEESSLEQAFEDLVVALKDKHGAQLRLDFDTQKA